MVEGMLNRSSDGAPDLYRPIPTAGRDQVPGWREVNPANMASVAFQGMQ
jgi:hypothetical protein